MTSAIGLLSLLLLCVAVLGWLLRRPRHADVDLDEDEIDYDALAEAEEEVRDLETFLSPEDADDALPDWGPGAPKA